MAPQVITLRARTALGQLSRTLDQHSNDVRVPFPPETTTNEALAKVQQALLTGMNFPFYPTLPISPAAKARLKEMAQRDMTSSSSGPRYLQVRGTLPLDRLPKPRPSTQAERDKIKGIARPSSSDPSPYVSARANLEHAGLPSIPARLTLNAIEATSDSSGCSIDITNCLFDTGAQMNTISADLVPESFRKDQLHRDWTLPGEAGYTRVLVNAVVTFTKCVLQITMPMDIVPLEHVPNQRSGVIFGQSGFIERMRYKLIPRLVLEVRENIKIGEEYWGEIEVEGYVSLDTGRWESCVESLPDFEEYQDI